MTEDKIKNAMDFYMLANNLKFVTNDGVQSIADEVYGSITLAAAIINKALADNIHWL